MYTVDTSKIRGKMAEKGFSITTLAEAVGINRNTLAKYLAKPTKIPYKTLSRMATLLCDSAEDVNTLFFNKKLTQNAS